MPISLSDKVSVLPRLGDKSAAYLKKLGLETISDLLFYLPFRYLDYRETREIASLEVGESANIQGEIILIQARRSYGKRMSLTEALIADDSETIKVIWFNQPFIAKNLKIGDRISISGNVSERQGQMLIASPQYEKISAAPLVHTSGLIPIYHLTSGLSQKQIRNFIKRALPLSAKLTDWLPEEIRTRLSLIDLKTSIYQIHSPKSPQEAEEALKRNIFSELFFRQLKSQITKNELNASLATAINFHEKETKKFIAALPYKLTYDQRKTAWEILQDIGKERPMSRLLEGDVGSGKTVVAAIALYNCALNKKKAVLMAPTEILARQHFDSLSKLFKNSHSPINIALLTGSRKDKISEETDIIVGTHALIYKKNKLADIALAIVDEQHRFGVKQRQNILDFNKSDKSIPHFLSMTATPIPRSLSLAIYGDLDLSIIKEMPQGRKEIITKLTKESERDKAYKFIESEIKKGRQAFVICPLVEDSDSLEVKSVKAEHKRLQEEVFPQLKIGLLHGKMSSPAKEKVMADMLDKKIDILVSTSIIEVGVDIANASLIAIESAERFGLAQLHQFRGRVGRSKHQSYCLLFTSKADTSSEKASERLRAMEKHQDGFTLAQTDLKLRGAGDIYGHLQSGFMEMQIATFFPDAFLKTSKEEIKKLLNQDPNLDKHPEIKEKLGDFEKSIHLE